MNASPPNTRGQSIAALAAATAIPLVSLAGLLISAFTGKGELFFYGAAAAIALSMVSSGFPRPTINGLQIAGRFDIVGASRAYLELHAQGAGIDRRLGPLIVWSGWALWVAFLAFIAAYPLWQAVASA